jgi:hypothetical protein
LISGAAATSVPRLASNRMTSADALLSQRADDIDQGAHRIVNLGCDQL